MSDDDMRDLYDTDTDDELYGYKKPSESEEDLLSDDIDETGGEDDDDDDDGIL